MTGDGGWFDQEAIDAERLDADIEQANFEAEGRAFGRRLKRAQRLIAEGKLAEAAAACPHGGGFPLKSLAGQSDPHAGEDGVRCSDCGSRLSAFKWDGGVVLVPCEVLPRQEG